VVQPGGRCGTGKGPRQAAPSFLRGKDKKKVCRWPGDIEKGPTGSWLTRHFAFFCARKMKRRGGCGENFLSPRKKNKGASLTRSSSSEEPPSQEKRGLGGGNC